MSSSRRSRRESDDDPDDEAEDDDEDDDEEGQPPAHTKHHPSKPAKKRPGHPVRRWKSSDADNGDDEETTASPGPRKPVYWRARDSLYFEPLVALAIVVVLVVGLYAYTQNWPPVYVVESDSMQHGPNDQLGLINTGDLVLAQKISNGSISPYVVGLRTGFTTYGEYGDVILYQPNGASGTPVIHRAILFLSWNPATRSYSASDLEGLPCGNASGAVYATPGTVDNCGTSDLTKSLELFNIGWKSVTVSLDLSAPALGEHSGYLTMGDNNYFCDGAGACTGEPDQGGAALPVISTLVEPGWIVGAARGMIPWFGSIKLLFDGNAGMVPPQSWQYLGLTIVGIIVLAFGIHFAFRREGIETPLRKREDEERAAAAEAATESEGEHEEGRARRWLRSLKPWRSSPDGEEGEQPPSEETKSSKTRPAAHRRGRPRPRVKRTEKGDSSDDDDL
jgi:signal peptidase I